MEETEPFVHFEIDRGRRLLLLHWQGFVPSDDYREGLLEAIQISKQENIRSWILNTRRMKVIRQSDQDWTVNVWFPQFKQLGLEHLCILISEDIFNQMAISSMVAKMRPQLQNEPQYFHELEAAYKWIQES